MAGELVYQTWQRITGRPWSDAAKGGFTNGSAAANLDLQKRLLSGWNPYAPAAPAPQAAPAAPAKSAYDIAQEAWQKNQNDYAAKAKEYDAAHPFAFDEALSIAAERENTDPYYKQQLADFLTGIERTRTRSQEDQKTLLDELAADTQSYTGRVKLQLDRAINNAKEGYNNAGLLSSGAELRAEGNVTVDSNANLADYLRGAQSKTNQINTQTSRTLQDTLTQEQLGRRSIDLSQTQDVASAVKANKQREYSTYELGRLGYLGPAPGVDYNTYDQAKMDLNRSLV